VIEIRGAEAYRRDGELARVVLRHRDDLGVGRQVENLAEQLQALGRNRGLPRSAQVEQHDIGLDSSQDHQRLIRGLADRDVEVREDLLELTPERAIVLEDQ
jgi:hypothetical protein